MNCPKCNFEIDDKMLVCPNCKKVLKLVCPKCKTVNQSNLCKKCGYTIIVKCHQCGKINQTINEKCAKCGFSTYESVAISNSETDEFACITIDFPHLDDLKALLGSTKLTEKFKSNLNHLVVNYANSLGITRELIDNIHVLKFNKSDTFQDSAMAAMNAAVELQNSITELNFKLNSAKNVTIQSNVAVLKRDIHSLPEHFKSGFDIKLINQNAKKLRLLNSLQIITDSSIYEQVCDKYDLSTLSSAFVNGKTVMFFELNIKKYIKIPVQKDDSLELNALAQLPIFDDQVMPEQNDLYDIDAINFDELQFNVLKTESINVISKALETINGNERSIINVKTEKEFGFLTQDMMIGIDKLKKFKHVFRVSCHEGMKYEPYGFFRELISDICNFSKAPVNFSKHSFEMFKDIDSLNYIYNLVNSVKRENSIPEKVRYLLFDIFFNVFSSIPNSLIYIEDFDKIDDSSYEILQLFFEKLDEFKISFLITSGNDFSLHKNSHFLLSDKYYTEISVRATQFKNIVASDQKKYKEILESFCMEKIASNFKGSFLYFNQAIDYLIDDDYLFVGDDGVLTVNSQGNIFIPTTLDSLVVKRLRLLSKDANAYKLFAALLFLGPRVDFGAINLLKLEDESAEIKKLINRRFVYKIGNSLFVNNYNLFKTSFITATNSDLMQKIAKELLEKIFNFDTPSVAKAFLYNVLDLKNEQIAEWENLSNLNSSLGDFSSYFNSGVELLKLVDENLDENSEKTEEDYKVEVYENISNLMYKFTPEKSHHLTQMVMENLRKSTDTEKTIELCNKMLQGFMLTGNYQYALESARRILSSFSNSSVNPEAENFNVAFFFISLIKIEILFSIGSLKDCIESADIILDVIQVENLDKLKPAYLSKEQFEDIIFDTLSFVSLAKIILLEENVEPFIETIQTKMGRVPEYFELFAKLQDVIHGRKVTPNEIAPQGEDRFSNILWNMITAFNEHADDYKQFAINIHHAKTNAKANRLYQIELFCDLLIGYSYFKLKEFRKATAIYTNVLELSETNGLKIVSQLSYYLISMLKFEEGSLEEALGIANNSVIKLERDSNSTDLLFYVFKILMCKILVAKNDNYSARLCLNDAEFIKSKYGFEFAGEVDLKEENDENTDITTNVAQSNIDETNVEV